MGHWYGNDNNNAELEWDLWKRLLLRLLRLLLLRLMLSSKAARPAFADLILRVFVVFWFWFVSLAYLVFCFVWFICV